MNASGNSDNAVGCPDCGTLLELPEAPPGMAVICPECRRCLERTSGRGERAAFMFAFATFILLFPANLAPLMRISVLGIDRQTRIGSGLFTLWDQQWVVLVTLVAAFAIVLPFIRFGLLSLVLGSLGLGRTPRWLGPAFRMCLSLDVWAMPDVLLLGAAVGYSRIAARLPVQVGTGGICLILAAVCAMMSRATLDRPGVWRRLECLRYSPVLDGPVISCTACDLALSADAEGGGCPRCGATLQARKPDTVIRTLALVLAGFAFYIPANVFPMNVNIELGHRVQYRIIDGVIDLFRGGFWPLGILIFCTSIAIPLLKLVGLSWFLLSIRRGSSSRLATKTRLFRLIDEIGRWSTIDVFTIVIFAPMIQFGSLATATAGVGGVAFILVVALTMLASRSFDPRLMWDAAGKEST